MSFHGVTVLKCQACELPYTMEIRLLKEPTNEEWIALRDKLNLNDNLCDYCRKQI